MVRICCIVVLSFILASCLGGGSGNNAKPEVKVSTGKVIDVMSQVRDTLDFGVLRAGEIAEKKVELRNSDTVSIAIVDISTDCGCTSVDYEKKPIKPGDTAVITFRYNSAGQSGWQFKRASILTTRSREPVILYLNTEVK